MISGINKSDGNSDSDDHEVSPELLNKSLRATIPLYREIIKAIKLRLNQLPPAAGMAGIYTRVDSSRDVWKAPANVSMIAVVSPAVNISHLIVCERIAIANS